MASDTERWEPIDAAQLQVGQHIKIDHRWFDHPFVRRMFQITSEREIATIREVELTRMFIDRRSPGADAPVEANPEAEQVADAALVKAQHEALAAAQTRDRVTLERGQALMAALNGADAASATLVDEFVDYLVAILNNSTTPLALMAPTAPRRSARRYVLQASDAVSLVALVGKRMGLKAPQLRALTQAAAIHILGLGRMPPQLSDEEAGDPQFESAGFRDYPLLSASILQQCGGFSAEALRIVREHRERPDGCGFPRKLTADAIHPHALLLGAVREFQIRCTSEVSPAVALAYLHRTLREVYGAEVISHLASAVLVHPVGTFVQLSDGRIARVMSVNEAARLLPVVEAAERQPPYKWTTLDLSQFPGLSIVRALDTSYLPPRMFETGRRDRSDAGLPVKAPAEESPAG